MLIYFILILFHYTRYCGSSLPQTHVSSTNELFIRFRSDSSHTRRGFIIFYEKGVASTNNYNLGIQITGNFADGWQMDEKVAIQMPKNPPESTG